jgi:hypothetical protein
MDPKQTTLRIIAVTAILCITGIVIITIVVFGTPFANELAERVFSNKKSTGLALDFDGSFSGRDGEQGFESGISFVPGYSGKGILIDMEDSLSYPTEGNINKDKGALEFWLKPTWDGDDGGGYVIFEVGEEWYNRMRIMKDGANNFRFMVWSSQVEYDAACSVTDWSAGEWHHVRTTWENGNISLFLDEELCDTQKFVVMPESLSSRFFIGSSAQGDLQAQGVIDEFKIFPVP